MGPTCVSNGACVLAGVTIHGLKRLEDKFGIGAKTAKFDFGCVVRVYFSQNVCIANILPSFAQSGRLMV